MRPIAIFYHCLFCLGNPPELVPHAFDVVGEQMAALRSSDLMGAASMLTVGINGGSESREYADLVIPSYAKRVYHGLESRSENLTIIEIEKWVPDHPGWDVLYFHAKGATHTEESDYGKQCTRWRKCMMLRCVEQWRNAVDALIDHDAAGCHWLTGMTALKDQNLFGGNFFWATSEFLAKLPSMYKRDRIKVSGISSAESRYEAEVWIGNGPMPKVKDLAPDHRVFYCP
jgi:hypothetical protein